MGRKTRRRLEEEDVQQRRLRVLEQEESSENPSHDSTELSPHNILNLQRTVGNQAVQRFIVQRAPQDAKPQGGPAAKDSAPSFVATITGAHKGKFKGNSRVVGHEGKIELLSVHFEPTAKTMKVEVIKRVDETTADFMNAMQTGERITAAQFMSIRQTEDGKIETGLTFDFSEGVVASVQYTTSEGIGYEAITFEFDLKKDKEKE